MGRRFIDMKREAAFTSSLPSDIVDMFEYDNSLYAICTQHICRIQTPDEIDPQRENIEAKGLCSIVINAGINNTLISKVIGQCRNLVMETRVKQQSS